MDEAKEIMDRLRHGRHTYQKLAAAIIALPGERPMMVMTIAADINFSVVNTMIKLHELEEPTPNTEYNAACDASEAAFLKIFQDCEWGREFLTHHIE